MWFNFTLGSRGFSYAVSGFGQVLKSDPRVFLTASPLVSSKAEDMSACGRRSSSSHARKHLWYPGWFNLALWIKVYFLLLLGMVMYDNEFETKENKI